MNTLPIVKATNVTTFRNNLKKQLDTDCSELVGASYKNQDIDTEVFGSADKNLGIWPIDIVNDEETSYLILTPTLSC